MFAAAFIIDLVTVPTPSKPEISRLPPHESSRDNVIGGL